MVADIFFNLGSIEAQFEQQKVNVRDQSLSLVDKLTPLNSLNNVQQPIIDEVSLSPEALRLLEQAQGIAR